MTNNVHITQTLLDDLEQSSVIKDLITQSDFENVLNLDRAIIYLLVDWSGPERVSRYFVYKAFNEIDRGTTPVFKIDCSDQQKKYVVDWLLEQQEDKYQFYYGGWGETILLEKGKIIDFIANPAKLGYVKTVEKIKKWSNTVTDMGPN